MLSLDSGGELDTFAVSEAKQRLPVEPENCTCELDTMPEV